MQRMHVLITKASLPFPGTDLMHNHSHSPATTVAPK